MIDGDPSEVTEASSLHELGDVARVMLTRPGIRTMLRAAGGAWALRALLGPPGPRDVLAAAGALAWWPLQEWLAHKHLLHLPPITIGGRTFDPLFARKHREHHADPDDVDTTLLPPEVIDAAIPAAAVAWIVLLGPSRAAVTGFATYSTMALVYEWTHLLVHTSVRPRSAFYARVRRNHRLHHYRNERYWLGFTLPHLDALLGTDPPPASVPRSKTACAVSEAGARV